MNRLLKLCLLLSALSLGSCSQPRPLLTVTVDNIDGIVTQLSAAMTLNGVASDRSPYPLPGPFAEKTEFAVYLPVGATGTIAVDVQAMTTDPCAIIDGQGTVEVAGERELALTVHLMRSLSPSCGPTVEVIVVGLGSVQSTPAGIDCKNDGKATSGKCSHVFSKEDALQLQLTATSDPTAANEVFASWSGGGCDQTNGPTCALRVVADVKVTASFAQQGDPCRAGQPRDGDPYGSASNKPDLNAVWGATADNVRVVGNGGEFLYGDASNTFRAAPNKVSTAHLVGIWGKSDGTFWIAAADGTIFSSPNSNMPPFATQASLQGPLLGLGGLSLYGTLWAVGESAKIARYYAGPTWSEENYPQPSMGSSVANAVWARDLGNIWAVGNMGTLGTYNYTTTSWSTKLLYIGPDRVIANLNGVAGNSTDLFIVGDNSTVVRGLGAASSTTWARVTPPQQTKMLTKAWLGGPTPGKPALWVVGQGATVWCTSDNGASWVVEPVPAAHSTKNFNGVYGIDDAVWVVGSQGALFRYR